MKTFILSLMLLATVSAVAQPTPSTSDDDEAALRNIKTTLWPQAYKTQDTELLGRLLHDSFQMIDNAGNHSNKEKELEWIANNQWNPGQFEYRIERLDIYGDMAIVAGQGVAENYQYRSSNVLIKNNGEWQAVSSHVSGYEQTGE